MKIVTENGINDIIDIMLYFRLTTNLFRLR